MIDTKTTTKNRFSEMLRDNVRTLRIPHGWVGRFEGNWADPLVFFIFTVLRPNGLGVLS